ncbi:MAG: T9SS type A sorting domain-containing protein [Flavobacteriales bacterium]
MKTVKVFSLLLAWVFVLGAAGPPQAFSQQGQNNLWMGGFEPVSPPPWGGVDLQFLGGSLEVSTMDREISYYRTNANITDAGGQLLFSTNGAYLANATGEQMLNGGDLNPSSYTSQYPEGLHLSQGCLVLPRPDHPGIYYLFHGTIDDQSNASGQYLYLTIIDTSLDTDRGGVVSKNEILIHDTLNSGKITAVRHANGRDWWVFCHKQETNRYYRLLVTPEGISVDGMQSIGVSRSADVGQVCFSPDGHRFAYYWPGPRGLEIFDFDRCTGLFSNPIHIPTVSTGAASGVAFSPNGRLLYVSSSNEVCQFDTEAPDVAASLVVVAVWDGFYSPSPPFATRFDLAQLAPDGKIYIGTGNGTLHLHVIHNPDEPGLACNLEQHGVELPRYFMNSLPNHPNYHLGAVAGSVCDSLGINTLTPALSQGEGEMRAFPNPSADGHFVLGYPAHAGVGWLEVRDIAGRVVLHERIPQWSTVHAVELLGQAAGMYNCTLRWGRQVLTTRVILTEP